MSFSVEYHKSVEEEVKDILGWYKERSYSAALNFLFQLKSAENILQKSPYSYRSVSGLEIRRIVLKQFPYKVYFRIDNTVIYILAVIHFSRSNRYIKRRLKK